MSPGCWAARKPFRKHSFQSGLFCGGAPASGAAQYLTNVKGLCVGISSGANYLAAKKMSERYGTAVTVFPDGLSK